MYLFVKTEKGANLNKVTIIKTWAHSMVIHGTQS